VFYAIGVTALVVFVFSAGGFTELLADPGQKQAMRAGLGVLVLLHFLAYVGALLLFKKNVGLPAWQRYGLLLLLTLPLLVYGSRTPVLAVWIAAAFIDERYGRRIGFKTVAVAGLFLALFFSLYLVYRSGGNLSVPRALVTDLSMGTGFVIAVREGFFKQPLDFNQLWTALSPILPGFLERAIDMPDKLNRVFTLSLFPRVGFTTSMGVMGEAHYFWRGGLSFMHYFLIGAALTWVGSYGWRKSLILAAIVTGFSWQIMKDGLLPHISRLLTFCWPIVAAYVIVMLLQRTDLWNARRERER
jgi:hypothetical protein